MKIQSFVFSPISENTYVLWDETTLDGIVVDPGCLAQYEKEELRDFILDHHIKLQAVYLTHAHLDHVFGCAFVRRQFGVKIHLHPLDYPVLADVENRCKLWGIPGYEPFEADIAFENGQKVVFGQQTLEVVHVPGHAPGHVAFINHDAKVVIGGDVLFNGSIGRTDFPGCSLVALTQSIKNHFYTLPDDYKVYCGHGEPTTIGKEKLSNPFVRG